MCRGLEGDMTPKNGTQAHNIDCPCYGYCAIKFVANCTWYRKFIEINLYTKKMVKNIFKLFKIDHFIICYTFDLVISSSLVD